MDINRMKPEERLILCRKYFYFGLAFLPFLWLVNTIWFGHFVFIQKGVPKIKKSFRKNGTANSSTVHTINNEQHTMDRISTATATTSRQRIQPLAAEDGGITNHNDQQPIASDSDSEVEAIKQRNIADIRRYVILSFLGTILWAIIIIAWVTIYQLKRAEWGEWGDKISFNIPRGIP